MVIENSATPSNRAPELLSFTAIRLWTSSVCGFFEGIEDSLYSCMSVYASAIQDGAFYLALKALQIQFGGEANSESQAIRPPRKKWRLRWLFNFNPSLHQYANVQGLCLSHTVFVLKGSTISTFSRRLRNSATTRPEQRHLPLFSLAKKPSSRLISLRSLYRGSYSHARPYVSRLSGSCS